jgi:hypothetical protein
VNSAVEWPATETPRWTLRYGRLRQFSSFWSEVPFLGIMDEKPDNKNADETGETQGRRVYPAEWRKAHKAHARVTLCFSEAREVLSMCICASFP